MSSPTVLISCAGKAVRWGDQEMHKQFAPVEGVKLLDRTLDQLRDRGITATIVATDSATFDGLGVPFYRPEKSRYWVETVLHTQELWGEQTCCLLGDVFFSDRAMDAVLAADGTRFFGRISRSHVTGGPAEVFAASWTKADAGKMVSALEQSLSHALECGDERVNGTPVGSPWQPYRLLAGVPIETHALGPGDLWVNVNDFTDDFDTREHYDRWCRRYAMRWICQGAPSSHPA